jgi:hypothetical protein
MAGPAVIDMFHELLVTACTSRGCSPSNDDLQNVGPVSDMRLASPNQPIIEDLS